MIARDPLKDAAHFEGFIERKREWFASVRYGPRPTDFYEVIAAMYSAGYQVDDLKPVFKLWVKSIAKKLGPTPADVVYPVCFALMMGADEEERATMRETIFRAPHHLTFSAFLAAAVGIDYPDDMTEEYRWKFFPQVRDMATNTERQTYLGEYVKRYWYNTKRAEYWWGSHKGGSIRYFGYWAWEIAATVRAYHLDDSTFSDCKYYPTDLAHYLD
ncbi:MAG: DUF1911 domain-containing protein [Propionibacteriaceae bacterium]|jgi:hypothetical protein|nr:DUF1911 domain-containing protein [Propionibacteriaceae bacterium]